FGPLGIHWYGLLIAVALVVGVAISVVLARVRDESPGPLAGILLLGLLSGLIGARLWYFVFRRDFYNPDPGRIFAIWQGGLAWHGALLGGVLGAAIYTWNREISFWTWADICAPGLILGQAIGRVGDIMNNQAFGTPSHGLWAVTIPVANRPDQYLSYSTFTNTAGYEAVWDVLVCGALLGLTLLQRRRASYLPGGSIFLAYLVLYSLARLPLEGFRVDSLWVMNMRVAQLASGVLIVVGGMLYVMRLLQGDRASAPASSAPTSQPVLAVGLGETYLQPSAQYLIAAARGGQARAVSVVTASLPGVNGHGENGRGTGVLNGTTDVLPAMSGPPAQARAADQASLQDAVTVSNTGEPIAPEQSADHGPEALGKQEAPRTGEEAARSGPTPMPPTSTVPTPRSTPQASPAVEPDVAHGPQAAPGARTAPEALSASEAAPVQKAPLLPEQASSREPWRDAESALPSDPASDAEPIQAVPSPLASSEGGEPCV
ncbi:MAG: prolipoprotein diacylglyceryl transferase, partial [Chloroflexota bacterium]